MGTVHLKHCPICHNDLPISEFGVCRARRDGRNLYCKKDIRDKVKKSREALKEYKTARQDYMKRMAELELIVDEQVTTVPVTPWTKLSPVERVREAIKYGARTQKEIQKETRLGKDEIGDALANLLLWTKEIKTQIVDDTRMYFINASVEQIRTYPQKDSLVEIARKGLGPVIKGEKTIRRVA